MNAHVFNSSPARLRIEEAGRAAAREAVAKAKIDAEAAEQRLREAMTRLWAVEPPDPAATASLPKRSRIRWMAILQTVSHRTGIPIVQIRSPRRNMFVVFARHRAMFGIYAGTTMSLPQIGERFGRDHTTVLAGIRAHARRNKLPLPRGLTEGRKR